MPRPSAVLLHEEARLDKASRVDRAAGVIRGVKVLGPTSPNTHDQPGATSTAYTPDCLKAAVPLFEGAAVYQNHPDRRQAHHPRKSEDKLGELVNARLGDDGVYADLRLLLTRPLSASVLEAAEKMPSAYSLSINGEADDADVVRGVYTVRKIGLIRSVDIVAKGGTNKGLFEGHMTTLREYLTGLAPKLDAVRRKRVKALLEADDMGMTDVDMAEPMPGDDPGADAAAGVEGTPDHEQALWDGFRAAMTAIIDGPDDAETKAKKIRQYLKAHEKLCSDEAAVEGEEVEEADEEEGDAVADDDDKPDEKDDKKDKKDKVKEGEELRLLRAEKKCRQLCEAARVEADGTLLEALARLPEAQQKQMIHREKSRQRRRTALTEGDQGGPDQGLDAVTDGKGFADLLRRRGVQ